LVAKTGIQWRDLPERFGKWDTVCHRFNEWCTKGVWQRVLVAVQDPDLEWLLLDSTVIQAHPHAAGMNTEVDDQALGRSRGGFGTKLHLAVDALGNSVTLHLSPGQDADINHAETLPSDHQPDAVVGDKGYDSDELVKTIAARGAVAVIPPKKNRKEPREYDRVLYMERNRMSSTDRCRRLADARSLSTSWSSSRRTAVASRANRSLGCRTR